MTNELEQLSAFRAADAAPDPLSRASALAALQARIDSTGPSERRVRRPRSFPSGARTRRLFTGGVALAAAGVTAAFIAELGSNAVPAATAAQALHKAAAAAEHAPPVHLGAGQFWYALSEERSVQTSHDGGTIFRVIRTVRRALWMNSDGAGRVVETPVGHVDFPTEADREAWVKGGSPSSFTSSAPVITELGGVANVPPGRAAAGPRKSINATLYSGYAAVYNTCRRSLSFQEAQALPTSPHALAARIRSLEEPCVTPAQPGLSGPIDLPLAMFTGITGLLREGPLPPSVRGALYDVAAGLPGIRLLGSMMDARGRRGVGVALDSVDQSRQLIFDPSSATLLETRTIERSTGVVLDDGLWNLTSGTVSSQHTRL